MLDHFRCYEVTGGENIWEKVNVTDTLDEADDQVNPLNSQENGYHEGNTLVKKAALVCVPCRKNGSEIKNPEFVMKLYSIDEHSGTYKSKKQEEQKVRIADQFGNEELTIKDPEFLAVPAAMEKIERDDQHHWNKWRRKRRHY